jgi:Alpha galactosidase C-terminal beta sandwich domain
LEIWSRKLATGETAVAMFNRSPFDSEMNCDFHKIGIVGQAAIRDLWQQKNLVLSASSFTSKVPAHGTRLIKLTPKTI